MAVESGISLLGIRAVAGPVIVAGVSGWWNRKNLVQDRT